MGIYVGLTMNEKPGFGADIRYQYYEALAAEGAIPLALPPLSPGFAAATLDGLHGLLLCGGGDIAPRHFGEESLDKLGEVEPLRDSWELALIREAWQRSLPMLAICRGMQVLNVALGGSLWQDYSYMPGFLLPHRQEEPPEQATQELRIMHPALAELMGAELISVNSHHHQTVKQVAPCLQVAALAKDGVIEALWPAEPRGGFCLGVQWHPERLDNEDSRRIFSRFVQAATGYATLDKDRITGA